MINVCVLYSDKKNNLNYTYTYFTTKKSLLFFLNNNFSFVYHILDVNSNFIDITRSVFKTRFYSSNGYTGFYPNKEYFKEVL